MEKLTQLFKSLSDETRLRILMMLLKREHCVCELTEILQETQPKISKHLAILKALGFVETKRQSQFIYYFLTPNTLVQDVLSILHHQMTDYPILLKDQERVSVCIRKADSL